MKKLPHIVTHDTGQWSSIGLKPGVPMTRLVTSEKRDLTFSI